jgi:HK97 family phage major capsid protein
MELEHLTQAVEAYHTAALGGIAGLQGRLDKIETALRRSPKAWQAEDRSALGSGFVQYLRKGDIAPELKALSVSTDSEGGYAVSATMSDQITQTLFSTSPVRPYARIVTVQSDAFEELVDKSDLEAQWAGETAARPETATPQLAKLRIPVREIYANPKATQQLLDDASIDVEAWLSAKLADKFARLENAAFVGGNGVTQPRGIVSYPATTDADATRAWGTLQYVASGASGAFAASNPADKLIELVYALKAEYRAGAVWLMNRDCARRVRQFKDGQGNYLWQPATTAAQPEMLLGFPVVLAEDMPAIAANSFSVAFGNLRAGYTIVDRAGVSVLRDPYSAKPHVLFYTRKRVGGDVVNFEAIKLLKFSAS